MRKLFFRRHLSRCVGGWVGGIVWASLSLSLSARVCIHRLVFWYRRSQLCKVEDFRRSYVQQSSPGQTKGFQGGNGWMGEFWVRARNGWMGGWGGGVQGMGASGEYRLMKLTWKKRETSDVFHLSGFLIKKNCYEVFAKQKKIKKLCILQLVYAINFTKYVSVHIDSHVLSCLYTDTCTSIPVYIHLYRYTSIGIHVYLYIHRDTHTVCRDTHTQVWMSLYTFTCLFARLHVYICEYLYTFTCVYTSFQIIHNIRVKRHATLRSARRKNSFFRRASSAGERAGWIASVLRRMTASVFDCLPSGQNPEKSVPWCTRSTGSQTLTFDFCLGILKLWNFVPGTTGLSASVSLFVFWLVTGSLLSVVAAGLLNVFKSKAAAETCVCVCVCVYLYVSVCVRACEKLRCGRDCLVKRCL